MGADKVGREMTWSGSEEAVMLPRLRAARRHTPALLATGWVD
jgi:hypothetical protein